MKNTLSTRPRPTRNDRDETARIVIVGVDRSETAERAAERAALVAASMDADLHVVMCGTPSMSVDLQIGGDHFHTDWVQETRAALSDVVSSLHCEHISSSVGEGDPADILCAEADRLGAEMIVVGNRRVQGMSRVLGSVAGAVTKQANCDVLVVNTTAD